jgi:DamX protein
MGELTATSAEPAYINRLALTHSPFTQHTPDGAFFDGSHIKQRRLLIQHLLRATTTPILLQADQGMGKTTLLTQLQRHAAADIQFCLLPASGSKLSQCQSLLADLQAETSYDEVACEALIKQRLAQLRRVNIVPVLLVEDIELQSEQVKLMLSDWFSWQGEEQQPLWQGIITTQTTVASVPDLTLQKLDMPALEPREVEFYLLQRLKAAGYQGEIPFSSRELQRFYRQSAGNPAKINQLAHQQLLGTAPKSRLPITIPAQFRQVGRWSVVIILGLIILAALIFQQQINSWIDKPESVEEEVILPPLAQEDEVATVIVGEGETLSQDNPRQELADLLAEIPPAGQTVAETETETGVTSSAPTEAVGREQTEEQKSAMAGSDQRVIAAEKSPQPEQASKASSSIHNKDWILQQKANHYTFQLMGAWDAAEVEEFIEKYALSGDVATFTSLRNNKPWHVLVYGVYPTRKAALTASNQWPAPLNTIPTWLRRLDSVQKQIKEKGVAP